MPRGGVYALLGIDLVSLFMGVSGFKEITNWRMALRNWIIVVISAGVSVLFSDRRLNSNDVPTRKKTH